MDAIERRIGGPVAKDFRDIEAVFINGPRQAGKSTFVETFGKNYKKTLYASFDDISLRAAEIASPGSTFDGAEEGLVILDEIQHVPESFLALKAKIDGLRRKKKKVKFLLTGSADVTLFPKIAEALVGRVYIRTMYPFSAAEILKTPGTFVSRLFRGPPPDLNYSKPGVSKIIPRASFPKLSLEIKNREQWFRAYLTTLLERDIKNLSDIDRIELFPRLLSVLANRAGGLLNDADLALALKVSQPTLKRYRSLLNGVFLTFLLPPWFKKLEKRFVKSPKVYFNDTMLLCHVLGGRPEELEKKRPEIYGFVLENFAASELNKQLSLLGGCGLYHFRTSDQKEIDFLVEAGDGRLLALEVKASATVLPGDFRHIRFLEKALPENFVRGIILYQGERAIQFGKKLFALPLSALWEL
ncbi:MAG: ATP-binding protein [Treponema sp.]|jgi:predicted AAA+ superfamily ATPase|nr:ATP-binding protein [Treponema sp.]